MRYSFPANCKSFNQCEFSNFWKFDRHTVSSFLAYSKLALHTEIKFSSESKFAKSKQSFYLKENWQTQSIQFSNMWKFKIIIWHSFPAIGKSTNRSQFSNWWKPDRHRVSSFPAYGNLVLYNEILFFLANGKSCNQYQCFELLETSSTHSSQFSSILQIGFI